MKEKIQKIWHLKIRNFLLFSKACIPKGHLKLLRRWWSAQTHSCESGIKSMRINSPLLRLLKALWFLMQETKNQLPRKNLNQSSLPESQPESHRNVRWVKVVPPLSAKNVALVSPAHQGEVRLCLQGPRNQSRRKEIYLSHALRLRKNLRVRVRNLMVAQP